MYMMYFDGAARTSAYTSPRGAPPNLDLSEIGAGKCYPYNFMFGGDLGTQVAQNSISAVSVSGAFQNLYPIKIVLTGSNIEQ